MMYAYAYFLYLLQSLEQILQAKENDEISISPYGCFDSMSRKCEKAMSLVLISALCSQSICIEFDVLLRAVGWMNCILI